MPKVPIPPLYQHIGQEVDVVGAANQLDYALQHSLDTYAAGLSWPDIKAEFRNIEDVSDSICRRQIGAHLAISLFRKPARPFVVRQVASKAAAGLVSQIGRSHTKARQRVHRTQ